MQALAKLICGKQGKSKLPDPACNALLMVQYSLRQKESISPQTRYALDNVDIKEKSELTIRKSGRSAAFPPQ